MRLAPPRLSPYRSSRSLFAVAALRRLDRRLQAGARRPRRPERARHGRRARPRGDAHPHADGHADPGRRARRRPPRRPTPRHGAGTTETAPQTDRRRRRRGARHRTTRPRTTSRRPRVSDAQQFEDFCAENPAPAEPARTSPQAPPRSPITEVNSPQGKAPVWLDQPGDMRPLHRLAREAARSAEAEPIRDALQAALKDAARRRPRARCSTSPRTAPGAVRRDRTPSCASTRRPVRHRARDRHGPPARRPGRAAQHRDRPRPRRSSTASPRRSSSRSPGRDEVRSVLILGWTEQREITADDIATAELAADSAAAGLARLEAEARRADGSAQDRAVVRVANALNATLDLQEILLTLVHEAALALDADLTGVFLGDAEKGAVATAGYGVPEGWHGVRIEAGQGAAGRVLETGATVRPHDYQPPTSRSGASTAKTALAVPMVVERRDARRADGRLDHAPPRPRRGPAHARGDRRPGHARLPQRRGLRARPARRPHRRADRRPQPRRDADPDPRGDRPRPPRQRAARRRHPRPRRLQERQRHPRPRRRRRAAAQGRAARCRTSCARTTRSPATAATSSSCCSPAPTRRRPRTSPSAAATRSAASARSASPPGTTASTPTGCSSRPTAR